MKLCEEISKATFSQERFDLIFSGFLRFNYIKIKKEIFVRETPISRFYIY